VYLVVKVGLGSLDGLAPLPILCELLRHQSNHHADDDHPDLADKHAPSVARLR